MDLDHDACYRVIQTRDRRFDGRLFVAVTTTGIYCRPFCPAPTPKPNNVRFFATAAAAQDAGFRPCLRCRPETSPELAFWHGSSSTVSRALLLIEAGALDEKRVDSLAERLGVGERHLRRLFRQYLGTSPLSIAQTRRVLLAKQLIQDTGLSMTEVALASGYTSIRRFNETFQAMFNRPPSAIRRSRNIPDQETPTGTVTVSLGFRPPYDWNTTIYFLKSRAIPGIETVSADKYARTVCIDGRHGMFIIDRKSEDALRAKIHVPNIKHLPIIIARIRRVFDLAADPLAIGGHLSQDLILASCVEARPGLRIPGAWDGFELAIRAIIGRNATFKESIESINRIVTVFGERTYLSCAHEFGLSHVFPTPTSLVKADLKSLGMPKAKQLAISSLSNAIIADPNIFSIRRNLEEAIRQLRLLPGLDEWTAQYIAMRELREPDAFPTGETDLRRAMADERGNWPTSAEFLARSEHWKPWRAYAAMHLWICKQTLANEENYDP